MTRRREVLSGAMALAGVGAGGVLFSAPAMAQDVSRPPDIKEDVTVRAGESLAVVDTAYGKVAGYIRNGVFTFKGIPYGDTTEGEHRFMPPSRPRPWSGVRSSRHYGPVSPQGARATWANDEEAFLFDWDDGVQGEDCLRLNIWTPGINDGKQRPVMVWLHGGGFSVGSSQDWTNAYDGENLARQGDVIVVSLNHRLNAFGFLNLAHYGERYAASANVGMLDIVAALEWVRDNVGGFGGNRNLVTVFGQSGGAGKVCALMGMPSAEGLFHRAIVESGAMLRAGSVEPTQRLADAVLAALSLGRSTLDRIHQLPFQQIAQVAAQVQRERAPHPLYNLPDVRHMADILGFAPVVDGKIIPAHPFDPQASELSAAVPLLVGSTLNEFVNGINHPDADRLSVSELESRVAAIYGSAAPGVLQAFRERSPAAKPFDLWSHIGASHVREMAIKLASSKAALGKAPAFLYWFTWQTPLLDGRPRAFHASELPFVFANTDRSATTTGGGVSPRALADKMSAAWVNFARSGNPDHAGIPHWPAFSPERVPTMIFDDRVDVLDYPDRAEQASISGQR